VDYSPYMPVDTVDETASYTEMQGPSSSVNQMAGKAGINANPTKALVAVWFLALALYWLIGWVFRGQRS